LKRETQQIFDLILKRLLRLSSPSVIQFINGLFGTEHPLDSTVEYPNTESVSRKLRRLMSDMVVIIGGIHAYHLEAEIKSDESIVIRVFEYGFAQGLSTKSASDGGERITIKFPNARIIYWETTKRTPDEVVLSLEFPNGRSYDYVVKTFKFLDHGIEELEKKQLVILLPFYVLKLRKRVASTRSPKRRAELSSEMKAIIDDLVLTTERAVKTGLLSEPNGREVLEHTERLYKELYQKYEEFKEGDVMLQDFILTYSEEAELRGIEKGIEEGIEKGREEGVDIGVGLAARGMLARGMTLQEISEITSFPVDKLKNLVLN